MEKKPMVVVDDHYLVRAMCTSFFTIPRLVGGQRLTLKVPRPWFISLTTAGALFCR